MNSRVRFYLGIFTTVLFVMVGCLLIVEQRHLYGGIVVTLGVLRGLVVLRQIRND